MSRQNPTSQENFMARALRLFKQNVSDGFAHANAWRKRSVGWVNEKLQELHDWEREHKVGLITWLALIILAGLMIWYIVDVTQGNVKGNAFQTGVGGLIGGAIIGTLASSLIALVIYLAILLANKLFMVLAPLVLFLPLVLWAPLYALWRALIVVAKLLLLIPLAILFVGTRLIQLWRGIFYTCPSRRCVYRGLPDYLCRRCDVSNSKLWPNLYGLLWHHCVKCDEHLPTLDRLGRNTLGRRCGGCGMPLLGKHAGRAPERLVAIVGGPAAGKTNYLLMTVNEITNGSRNGALRIRGEIDDKNQEAEFQREWQNLAVGLPAAKTTEVRKAFLLYAKFGRAKCQLYLYDAPGEEFTSISSMTQQQYFPLLEGFILLVDPLSFEAVRWRVGGLNSEILSLQEVVNSTLVTALSGVPLERNGKSSMRVAVVISKADLECVREQIGDIKQKSIAGEVCHKAIVSWGGENAIRAIEHRFEAVAYFACSPLGRAVDTNRREPFKSSGVLEPLSWIMTGKRMDFGAN